MRVVRAVFGTMGALALFVLMATDAIAVIGRHTGRPLIGSIEISQFAALVSAASALVWATLAGTHAEVHLLTERLPQTWRARLGFGANLLAVVVFAAMALGSAWLMRDLWNGYEQTELFGLPIKPLRMFVTVAAAMNQAATRLAGGDFKDQPEIRALLPFTPSSGN